MRGFSLTMTILLQFALVAVTSLLAFDATSAERFFDFNIPAAPLARALGSFGAITQEQLLLDASIADGRRSEPVVGRFTPEAALRQMLAGTGLTVQPIEGQGFAVVFAGAPDAQQVDGGAARRLESYSALIQTALGNTLCAQTTTAPGAYRSMAQLWIGRDGHVVRADLLTSSGIVERDTRLTTALQNLSIGVPPPNGMPQPVTLLVTAESPGGDYCAALRRRAAGDTAIVR